MGPVVMASLRTANFRLRNYFKENYIPQVCEVLEPRGGGVTRGEKPKISGRSWGLAAEGAEGFWGGMGQGEVNLEQAGDLG